MAEEASQPAPFARVALLGIGYMGGSLALALRASGLAKTVVGYDKDPGAATLALERGIIQLAASSPAEAVRSADLVILAAPVRALEGLAKTIAGSLTPGALLLDIGSVKGPVADAVRRAVGESHFVPCHPLAGAEKSGVGAAVADLYHGRPCVLCPFPTTDLGAIDRVEALWRAVGSHPIRVPIEEHDGLVAALSHLPHAVAFALARAAEQDGTRLRNVLPGGTLTSSLRDTTRVAASSPEVWRDIFLMNGPNVLPLIDRFVGELQTLRAQIEANDAAGLHDWLTTARTARRRLFED
ncbi:MAG: prephenate dehydrogenase/arogenate dehydrogenase family protein [Deltaproteobacteria bacterium]|nr:prephenate dehydrogenase/arogenate dehydrogenase family protein [Deltaproteobacteria bacterium]